MMTQHPGCCAAAGVLSFLCPIRHGVHARLFRAVGAAVELAIGLDAVPHDVAAAVGTLGGHGVDGTLEAVERAAVAIGLDGERLVIIVAADVALHGSPPEDEEDSNWRRTRMALGSLAAIARAIRMPMLPLT